MSFGLEAKNFLGASTEQIPVRVRIADAFRRATAGMKAPAKTIALATGKTPEMAEKWLAGDNCPNAEALLLAMANFDEVWDEVRAICGRGSAPSVEDAADMLAMLADRLRERRG